jgi:hypothetical protein
MGSQYSWNKLYQIASLQTDPRQLRKAITEAETAIEDRLYDCPPPIMDEAEVQAIGKTLTALAMLKSQGRLISNTVKPSNGHYPAAADHQ